MDSSSTQQRMGFLLFIYLIVAAYGILELITGQPHQPVSLIKIWRLVVVLL